MPDHVAAQQPAGAEAGDSGTSAITCQGPVAVLLTADRYLAAYLSALHPGVTAVTEATDPRAHRLFDAIPAETDPRVLKAGDGLLVLAGSDTVCAVYIGADLDDAGIWSRAVTLRAAYVALLPDGELCCGGGSPTTSARPLLEAVIRGAGQGAAPLVPPVRAGRPLRVHWPAWWGCPFSPVAAVAHELGSGRPARPTSHQARTSVLLHERP